MSLDGTYGFVYSGNLGVGVGALYIEAGTVVGSDYAGGRYRGTAIENDDGSIHLRLGFTVAPGAQTVQGSSAQDLQYVRKVDHTFPAGFGDGEPQRVPSPPGHVTVMVKRVADEFKPAATDGFFLQLTRPMPAV